jgi:hypothetical protein
MLFLISPFLEEICALLLFKFISYSKFYSQLHITFFDEVELSIKGKSLFPYGHIAAEE